MILARTQIGLALVVLLGASSAQAQNDSGYFFQTGVSAAEECDGPVDACTSELVIRPARSLWLMPDLDIQACDFSEEWCTDLEVPHSPPFDITTRYGADVPEVVIRYGGSCPAAVTLDVIASWMGADFSAAMTVEVAILNRPVRVESASLTPRQVFPDTEVALAIDVTDPCSTDSFFDVEVKWGDEPVMPEVASRADGSFSFTHVYAEPGLYEVTVEISDPSGDYDVTTYRDEVWVMEPDTSDTDDRDGDGITDAAERAYGLNPYDPSDADLDPDGDGLTNREEVEAGTPPFYANTPPAPTLTTPQQREAIDALPLTMAAEVFDPDGDTVTVEFAVYRDGALLEPVWTGAATATDGTAQLVVGDGLALGSRYYWRARGCDPSACGDWSQAWFFDLDVAAAPPTAPVALRPFGVLNTTFARFTWLPSVSLDDEMFTYTLELLDADGEVLLAHEGIPSTTTSFEVEGLDDDTTFSWRVSALDESGARSEWSETLPFGVRVSNGAPDEPRLVSPLDIAVAGPDHTLLVENGLDPDGDATWVEVELTLTGSFGDATTYLTPASTEGVTATAISVVESSDDLRWRARMTDGSLASAWVDGAFSVRLRNTSPPTPMLIEPVDAEVETVTPSLAARLDDDVDGDDVTARFEVAEDAQFATVVGRYTELPVIDGVATLTQTEPLVDGAVYFWRAAAVDVWSAQSTWSSPGRFVVHVANTAPTAPQPTRPLGLTELDEGMSVVLEVSPATDAEGDELSYVFELYAGRDVDAAAVVAISDPVEQGERATRYVVPTQLDPGVYTWRAQASDGVVLGPWSDTATFEVTAAPESGGCQVSPSQHRRLPSLAWLGVVALIIGRRRTHHA